MKFHLRRSTVEKALDDLEQLGETATPPRRREGDLFLHVLSCLLAGLFVGEAVLILGNLWALFLPRYEQRHYSGLFFWGWLSSWFTCTIYLLLVFEKVEIVEP